MATPLYDHETEGLDEPLALLAASPAEESRLVEGHAQFARTNRLGSMPGEYETTLEMARKAAGKIPDRGTGDLISSIADQVLQANGILRDLSPHTVRGM
jgi:hypothetical protein